MNINDLKKNIIDFLNADGITCDSLMLDDSTKEFNDFVESLGVNFSTVDSYGGEGRGDEYWTVIKFVKNDDDKSFMNIRFNGWYASYVGAEYIDFDIVEEKEIMTTIWGVVNI